MNYAYTEQMMRETLKLKPGSRINFLQPEGKGKEYHIQKIRGKVIKTYPYYVLVEIEKKKEMHEEFEPWWSCPECGSRNLEIKERVVKIEYGFTDGYKCKECGHRGIVRYPNM